MHCSAPSPEVATPAAVSDVPVLPPLFMQSYLFDGVDFSPFTGPPPATHFALSDGAPVTVAQLRAPFEAREMTFSIAVSFSFGRLSFAIYVPDLPALLTLCDCLCGLFEVTRGVEISGLRAAISRR
jgi:hypothetical protein